MTWNTFPHYWFSLMRFCLAMIFLTKELAQDMGCFLWLMQKLSSSSAAKFKDLFDQNSDWWHWVYLWVCYNKVLCNTILYWWIPLTKASDTELWIFFGLHLNKWLSKQSWGWWFETPSCSLWRHCNVLDHTVSLISSTWHHCQVMR